MAYDVTTVTVKGTELLAAATAANNLVLAGCDATQTFITKPLAINVSSRPSSPFSTTTNVRLEGSNNGHVFIRIFFTAGNSTGGDVNTLYLYGHSADDPTNDYVLAVMSSETPFHLPEEGDISNTYGTLLDIVYNVADGSVSSVTSSVYATYSEYANLRDRAVTTHSQGDPSVGENQTILGNKTFVETVSTRQPIEYIGGDALPLIKTGEPGFISDTTCSTEYGARSVVSIPINIYDGTGASNKGFYTSGLKFQTRDAAHTSATATSTLDIHALKLSADQISGVDGVSRSLSIQSSTRVNDATYNLASVSTHLDRTIASVTSGGTSYIAETETGRVELVAKERLHGKSARIQLATEYVDNITSNPKSRIDSSADQIRLSTYDSTTQNGFDFKITDSSLSVEIYDGGDVGLFTVGIQDGAYSLYGIGSISVQSVNLGTNDYPFDHVYATTVHGSVTNATNATNATNDANGNAITSYVKSISPISANYETIYLITQGNSSTQQLRFPEITATVLQGKDNSTDSGFGARIGAVGLFLYTGSVTTKAPGETVSGSDLKPASLMKEYSSGDFKIISHPTTSASGTWSLLTYLSTSSSGDAALVLAVKISES